MVALLSCAPATAQSGQSAYDQAVEARRAGDHAHAIQLLAPLAAADPNNVDAQFQLGLALLSLGRLDEAEAALRRTLALAPDYSDARLALARVQQRRGDWAAAKAEIELADPAHPEAGPLRRQIEAGEETARLSRWRLDFDNTHSFLNEGQSEWQESAVRVAYLPSRARVVNGAFEVSRRFARTDTYGEIRIDHRFPKNAGSAYFFAGGTPNADFRPTWQLGVGGTVRISRARAATLVTIDVRQARYRIGDIQTLNPGVDQYLAKGRAWIGVRWINIFNHVGRRQGGWLVRGDLLATHQLRIFVGAADAPETSEGFVANTASLFGGMTYDLNKRVSVRLSVARDNREMGADRLHVGLGAGLKL